MLRSPIYILIAMVFLLSSCCPKSRMGRDESALCDTDFRHAIGAKGFPRDNVNMREADPCSRMAIIEQNYQKKKPSSVPSGAAAKIPKIAHIIQLNEPAARQNATT